MNIIKKMIPYLLIILIAFYLLPLFIKDTGSGMFMLLLIIPIICAIVSLIYGKNEGYNIIYPIIITVIFIPAVFIHFNESAFIYAILYGIITTLFNFFGSKLKKV